MAISGISAVSRVSLTMRYHLHLRPVSFDFSALTKVFYANRGICTIQPDVKLTLICLNGLSLFHPVRILIAITLFEANYLVLNYEQ